MVAISRAPIEKLEAFKRRMGWNFKWVSSGNNDFNYDYQVSFTQQELENEVKYNYTQLKTDTPDLPGVSVFYRDSNGDIFHTYSVLCTIRINLAREFAVPFSSLSLK